MFAAAGGSMVQGTNELIERCLANGNCPRCFSPNVKRDVLRRINSRSFLPVLSGCSDCNAVWRDNERSESEIK